MPREIYGPRAPLAGRVQPVIKGGTGTDNLVDAPANMGLVDNTKKNVDNGVVGLDGAGKLPSVAFPISLGINNVNINGTFSVSIGSTSAFQITDYDSFRNYTVSASAGNVSRSGDTITFVAPATVQSVTMIVNGRSITIDVTPVAPATPSITSPVNGATGSSPAGVTFTASAFVNGGDGSTHLSSDWQVASDSGFSNIVRSSIGDTTNKTTWASGSLSLSTTYYARVRYRASNGSYSGYSTTVSFTTRSTPYATVEEAKIVITDKAASDFLTNNGYPAIAVSADGSRLVVATTTKNSSNGAVYIFSRSGSTWTQEQKIAGSNAMQFGMSLSLTDDATRLAVGYGSGSSTTFSAYVYIRTGTTWALEQTLNTGAVNSNITTVAITGDGTRVFVGRRTDRNVSVFLRSGSVWTLETSLQAADTVAGDYFGSLMWSDVDGTRLIVSAWQADGTSVAAAGAVYVFRRTGTSWVQEQKLVAPVQTLNAYFGQSACISSDGVRIAVGAYNSTVTGSAGGQAYIFVRSGTTWTLEKTFPAPDSVNNRNFGMGIGMDGSGSVVAIGCRAIDTQTGAIYLFSRSGSSWSTGTKMVPSDATTNIYFGQAVGVSKDASRIVGGAPQSSPGGTTQAGCAYVFA